MIKVLKVLLVGLCITHGTIILYKVVKGQKLRSRAFIILGIYLSLCNYSFFISDRDRMESRKQKLILENTKLEASKKINDIYYSDRVDYKVYNNNKQINWIDYRLGK